MSEVKQKCELTDCNRGVSTRCYCCNKSICTRHFTEHIEAVRAQVDPLENEINAMADKIRDLTIEKFTEGPLAKLYQWKNDMHQLIDGIFVTKSKEIEEVVERNNIKFTEYKKQQWETVMKIQEDIKQLAEDGDATFEQIRMLRNKLTMIEINLVVFQNSFLSINAQVFGEGLVTVSSALNTPLTNSNTQPSTTLQSSMCTSTNFHITPTLGVSIYQPAGFHGYSTGSTNTSPSNLFGTNPFPSRIGLPTTANNWVPFDSAVPTLQNNPFSTVEDATNSRPVVKARRRAKP